MLVLGLIVAGATVRTFRTAAAQGDKGGFALGLRRCRIALLIVSPYSTMSAGMWPESKAPGQDSPIR